MFKTIAKTALAGAVILGAAGAARAADELKIGMVVPMTGPLANHGRQISNGVNLYLAQHDHMIGGRKVRLIVKDDAPGTAGDVSKRMAQELVVQDNVDILVGFGLTPSAFAVAPLATEAKKPMVVMNAATSAITTKSPYLVRTSMTLPQVTAPIAAWAAKNGIKTVFTVVADYGPGHDAEAQFKKTFTEGGGKVVGEIRTPVKSPDFAPYLQKIKDTKPDAVFIFMPAGELSVGFMKGYKERGLAEAGIKLISTGDVVEEDVIDAIGDAAVGEINSFHYAEAHDSPVNKAYVAAYYKAYPKERPNFMSVGGYDGMTLIDKVLQKSGGKSDAESFIAAAKGMAWESPRGPVSIDPETRDIVQNVYIRKVEKVGDRLQNIEFDKVAAFKDPGKQ